MARTLTRHRCSDCGATALRWTGRCPACGAWNTMEEEVAAGVERGTPPAGPGDRPVDLVSVDGTGASAVPTGLAEFDRVLSGGLVPGSVTLVGGEPGIGKSTLLLQVLAARAASGDAVLLVAAEESAHQVRLRAERLGSIPADLQVLATTDVGAVLACLDGGPPALLVIDSIQALATGPATPDALRTGGPAGSVAQVRTCAELLVQAAKSRDIATILVGHVTKDGTLAGPRTLEHMVDTVLAFEGDRHHALRLLQAVKHRFGPTGELGLFEMGDQGLGVVEDPASLLLGDRLTGLPGGMLLPALQGRRTLVVELQALVTPSGQAQPKRVAVGLDGNRLVMTLAVLTRILGLPLGGSDVFASVAGGIRVTEPAADLAVAIAVTSAATGAVVPPDLAAVGEVGLAGEIRQVSGLARRVDELRRLGVRRVVVPASAPEGPPGIELVRAATVFNALVEAGALEGWGGA